MHQEITLVCMCRLRMCLYVTMTLNDIYVYNNFYQISLRRLIFNPHKYIKKPHQNGRKMTSFRGATAKIVA